MSESDFDDVLKELRRVVSARAEDLDTRWAEFCAAVHAVAIEARSVGRAVESHLVELEGGDISSPPVDGQLVINATAVGLWIPDPYHDDPLDLYGRWIELEEVANDYKLVILKAELHHSLAKTLLTALQEDAEVVQRPISRSLLARSEPPVSPIADELGWLAVAERWKRATACSASRPRAATTQARSLVEDVAKHILVHRDRNVPSNLKSAVRQALSAIGGESEVHDKIRGGLQTLEQAIVSARNDKGDAHGAAPNDVPPTPAEAQLYVTVAGGIAAYLMNLHMERVREEAKS